MSLKAELEIWAAALEAYDEDKFDVAMEEFDKIADTSKICWNIGIILATLGKHEDAVARFDQATKMDMYFTVAYQQKGVSNFVSIRSRRRDGRVVMSAYADCTSRQMLGRYEAAHKDFEDALLYLRGNQTM
jgi:tetratricopeptide (TPR) repeat protein